MKALIIWGVIIFLVLVVYNRNDILHDIGAGVRDGVEAIKDGYNGDR